MSTDLKLVNIKINILRCTVNKITKFVFGGFIFLAAGESLHFLASHFGTGKTTLSDIAKNTSEVIWDVIRDEYLHALQT